VSLKQKEIIVLTADEYEDLEAWYPILRLKENGANVTVVASDNVNRLTKSKHGYPLEADKMAAEVDPTEYDGVIVPGGWAPDKLRRCDNTLKLVKKINEAGGLVAAICHGGWVLASADIIKNKKLTSTEAIKDDLENAGAEWVNKEVVIDDNLITSRSPADLPAFMMEIIKYLA